MTDTLFLCINNFKISGQIEYPNRILGMDNSMDPIAKMGDDITEICDVTIDGLSEDEFKNKVSTIRQECLWALYLNTMNSSSRSAALMIYDDAIIRLQSELDKYITTGKSVSKTGHFSGVYFRNVQEIETIHPDTLSRMEHDIWHSVLEFIYNSILISLKSQLTSDRERLNRTRLPDFKRTLIQKLPPSERPVPSLKRNRFSFVLNPEKFKGAASYRIRLFYDLLVEAEMLDESESTYTVFSDVFGNRPIRKKILLTKKCTKAFLKTLLSEFKTREIIINSDYRRAASLCFEFAEDPGYDWDKLRKTSSLSDESLKSLVEKCVKAFI